jgi:hypothetical protein
MIPADRAVFPRILKGHLARKNFFCLQEISAPLSTLLLAMADLTALLHTIASRLEAIESHLGIAGFLIF